MKRKNERQNRKKKKRERSVENSKIWKRNEQVNERKIYLEIKSKKIFEKSKKVRET